MIKLFVLDLDGTLLNSNNDISKENIEALNSLSDTGVKIVFASGRVLTSLRYYMNKINLKSSMIANNGAIIAIDENNILKRYDIEENKIERLIKFSNENNMYFHMYDEDTFYARRLDEKRIHHLIIDENLGKKYQVDLVFSENPLKIAMQRKRKILKFQITANNMSQEEVVERLKQIEELSDLYMTFSGFSTVEIMNGKVNKYNSILELSDFLGINKNEIAAIGDFDNDIEMIENAKLGFAMGNARDSVKEISDYVVSSNNSFGIKEAVEKIKEFNRNA
ncbi:MAG: HAD family hydrolase [Tissierellia bacterium]|nr:HAD family hydrolase [Tissierellia bacterium]